MGREAIARALTALALLVCATLGAGAAAAGAAVTGLTVSYQGSTVAGERNQFVRLDFTLQNSLGVGQTIVVRAPPGSDLAATFSYTLDYQGTGWSLNSFTPSDGNSTMTFRSPVAVAAGTPASISIGGSRNTPVAGSYRWTVSTALDSAGESQAVTIAPRPLSALTVIDGDGQRTPVAQPFAAPLTVRTSDDLGNPIAPPTPVDVTFTVSTDRAARATFAGGATSATVTSDANGLATAPPLTANTVAGSFDVTITTAGLTGTEALLVNGAGAPTSIALAVDPSLVPAEGFQVGHATVDLGDAYGNPVGPDDLTGAEPQLSAVGSAVVGGLSYGEGSWKGMVFPTGTADRSTITASFGALTASAPFDAALAPLLGTPAVAELSATGAQISVPLTTSNAPTDYVVQYGTQTVSDHETEPMTAARDAAPGAGVTVALTGLRPQTTYLYRVVAANAIGSAQTEVRSFTTPAPAVDPPPGGGGGGGDTPPGGTPPGGAPAPAPGGGGGPTPARPAAARLSAVRLTPSSFAVRGRRAGATLRFTLDRAATVRLQVDRQQPGIRVRGRCVAPGRRANGPRCTRWRSAGSRSITGRSGANSVRFDGRLGGRALAPGRYRLTLTPAGGRATTVTFTVRRR